MSKINKLLKKKKAKPIKQTKTKVEELLDIECDINYESIFIPEDRQSVRCTCCNSKIRLEDIDNYFFNDIRVRKVGCCEDCETIYLVEGDKDAI